MKRGNPHTIKGKGFDAHPENIRKRHDVVMAVAVTSPPDYSKREITSYTRPDLDTNDYIQFGSDNLFPQALAFFSRVSPNHRGVLVSKEKFYHSDGIVGLDTYSQQWVDVVNAEGESLNEVQKRIWTDEHRIGNEYIELITDRKGSFLFISQQDATACRLSKNLEEIVMHPDWRNYEGPNDKLRKTIAKYPKWSEDTENPGILHSIYHKFGYEPEFTYYGIVGYISGKDSIQIDYKTNKWNLSRIVNGFRPGNIMFVPVKDKVESQKVLYEVQKHMGDGNQGKLLTVTKSRAMEGQKAEDVNIVELKTEDSGSWLELHKQSTSDIIMAHSWFRSLCSMNDNTGFDTKRIINEWNIAQPQIQEAQKEYTDLYQKLHKEVTGKELQIEFRNSPPLKSDKYFFIWELREKKGMAFDKTDPAQQIIILKDE